VQIFNLIPGDIGRPLMDITSKIGGDLVAEIEVVLAKLQTSKGRWQLRTVVNVMRLLALPNYRRQDRWRGDDAGLMFPT